MFKKFTLIFAFVLCLSIVSFAQGTATSPAPSASPAAEKAARFTPTKDQIKQGQEILIKEKFYTGEATGVYGESRPAIKAYQKAHGLDANGKFDRATLDKMGIPLTDKQKGVTTTAGSTKTTKTASTSSPSSTNGTPAGTATEGPKRPAPFTATKDQVMALQKVLKDGKMYSGEANGERSDDLKEAVKKYQDTNGLKATGGINAATLEKAGIALTDKQKQQVAQQAAYDAANKKN